ncbi:hypothetical protein JCM8097_001997 [Rhodosporidiobolus ruineniae]
MRPFVVRLDPTSLDRDASSSSSGQDDLAHLKLTWNAWNAKARTCLDQGSRIENLYWRRWHMEQRHGPVGVAPQANLPHDLSASVEAVERRRATEDLEAFLRNTLQQAQPAGQVEVVHNPPTYDAFRSTSSAQQPAPLAPQPPTFQPPVIHAPQPQRLAFNPSPEWQYASLPGVSQPPPSASAAAHQSRIIATPAWTALISDAAAASPSTSALPQQAVPQQQQQQPQPQQPNPMAQAGFQANHLFPGAGMPGYPPFYPPAPSMAADPFAAAAAAGFFGAPPAMPQAIPPPIPSPSFTLPPTATLFSDLPSALSSAPPTAAPPAFFSSYGMYQPVVAPYPRFLTPSPEPSVLGELELELGPATGEFDASAAAAAAAAVASVGANGGANEPDGMDRVWRDLEERADSVGDDAAVVGAAGAKKDPFEGMTLAQMRSRANSLEAVDREAARFQAYGVGSSGLSLAEEAAREVEAAAAASTAAGPVKAKAAPKGKRKAENGGAGGAGKKKAVASAGASPEGDACAPPAVAAAGAPTTGRLPPGGKKNRNPHSTQLPGNGQRRQPKEEAGEGHEGPICSHCGSITTPLWRRGPEDELLCNACGLYLKLHGKARPKTFGKNPGSKRSSNGAAAQAAASGVPPSCNNCGATSTPMWRKDQEGRLCCNACSLYYKLHKVNRPASLAQKRKAAAAAKANLAAAAAGQSTTDANAEASTSNATPPNQQLPTPATSTEATPASSAGTPAALPPAPPVSALPPLPPAFQLPPNLPSLGPPGAPGIPGVPPLVPQIPGWPMPPPSGYPFPPTPAHPPPQLHHPQPQHHALTPEQQAQFLLHHQQQQQQHAAAHAAAVQGGKFALPPQMPPPLPSPNPFAQTAWGALAYGIVSAAAAEEANGPPGSGRGPPTPQPPPPA